MTIRRRRKSRQSPERHQQPGNAPRSPNLAPELAGSAPGGPSTERHWRESFPNQSETPFPDTQNPVWEGNYGFDKVSYQYPIDLPNGWRRWKYHARTRERNPDIRIPNGDGGGSVYLGVRPGTEDDECEGWLRVEFNPAKLLHGEDGPPGTLDDIATAASEVEARLPTSLRRKAQDLRKITKLEIARDFHGVDHIHEHLETFARYRRKGTRAPNRSWGVGDRLDTVCLGRDRHTGTVFYDKSKERNQHGGESILNRPGSDGGSGYWFPTLAGSAGWAA